MPTMYYFTDPCLTYFTSKNQIEISFPQLILKTKVIKFLKRMFCLGGFVRGVFGKGGFCPGAFCPGVYVRGVFVWGFFVLIPFPWGLTGGGGILNNESLFKNNKLLCSGNSVGKRL